MVNLPLSAGQDSRFWNQINARSSSGRTVDSGSANEGSNPSLAAKKEELAGGAPRLRIQVSEPILSFRTLIDCIEG